LSSQFHVTTSDGGSIVLVQWEYYVRFYQKIRTPISITIRGPIIPRNGVASYRIFSSEVGLISSSDQISAPVC
jgi:hypothetical protein